MVYASVALPAVRHGVLADVMEVRVSLDFKTLVQQAIDYGIIPVGFIVFTFYLVHLNRNLQRQNEQILNQMIDLVRELSRRTKNR